MRGPSLIVVACLLAVACANQRSTPEAVYKPTSFAPFKVQSSLTHHPASLNMAPKKRDMSWPIPIRTTSPGTLASEVKENRAQYETNTAPLYLMMRRNATRPGAVECVRGNGWFGVTPNTPLTSLCLPWESWPLELLRLSLRRPVPGQPQCSISAQLQNYPHCGLGYHCDESEGRCVRTQKYEAGERMCPKNSGLLWSKSKKRCVQCTSSSIKLPTFTPSVAHPDTYRTGYVCDSDGNAIPPLAVSIASQLHTEPRGFLYLGIFLVLIISAILYSALAVKKRVKAFRAKRKAR